MQSARVLTHPALARQRFREIAGRPEPLVDLVEASLVISLEENAHLDIDHYLQQVGAWTGAVQGRLEGSRDVERIVESINGILFDEEGFRGENDDYYDPRSALLNEALDRHAGLPIALSILYIEISRRVVVVVVLTMEALFLEEEPIDRLDDALDVMRTFETLLDRAAPCTELLQIVVEIEPRVVFERDHQRGFDEVEKRLWTSGKLHETLTRQSGMGQNTAGLHRSSLRLLQRFHLAAKLVTDRHLGLRVPIEKDYDDSSGGGENHILRVRR